MDEHNLEQLVASRIRQRHRDLQAFVPPPPPILDIVGSAGAKPAEAHAAEQSTRRMGRKVLGATACVSAVVAALVIALVMVSVRSGGVETPVGSSAGTARVIPAALAASDAQHLIVVGSSASDHSRGAAAMSEDGGLSWSSRELDTPPLNGVAARGSTVIATADCSDVSGPDCVWRSGDGGKSFVELPGVPRLVRPALADERTGWLMTPQVRGEGTTLWHTVDGGVTWGQTTPECDLGAQIVSTVALSFPTSAEGWTACVGAYAGGQEARVIVRSSATGSTSETMSEVGGREAIGVLPAAGELKGLSMTAGGYGWLWTADQIYVSEDAGRTWKTVSPADASAPPRLAAAVAVGHGSGFAILADGTSPTVASTGDGGVSWFALAGFPAAQPTR